MLPIAPCHSEVIRTIRTIRDYAPWIAHYHTAGVPGRHEIDDTPELNYPAILRAIRDTGFAGYLAHEFIPVRDPLTSLREAVALGHTEPLALRVIGTGRGHLHIFVRTNEPAGWYADRAV